MKIRSNFSRCSPSGHSLNFYMLLTREVIPFKIVQVSITEKLSHFVEIDTIYLEKIHR